MAERSQDWLDQARSDVRHAENDVAGEYYDWACFSAQQAAEKALKALYQKHNQIAWGHSVRELLEGLSDQLLIPDELRRASKLLDKYYIIARYPNGFASGSPKDYFSENEARDAISSARQIIRFSKDHLA
jgi:HEPN domain-containing protein